MPLVQRYIDEHNNGFRQLRMRVMAGTEEEMGLVFLAQNLRKLAA